MKLMSFNKKLNYKKWYYLIIQVILQFVFMIGFAFVIAIIYFVFQEYLDKTFAYYFVIVGSILGAYISYLLSKKYLTVAKENI